MIKKRLPGVGTLEVCKLTSISVKNRQPPNLREMKMHFLFDTQNTPGCYSPVCRR